MHPSGIKCGLSYGLLDLKGSDVVVSERFFEGISSIVRRTIRRNRRVSPDQLWGNLVSWGVGRMVSTCASPRQEWVPFIMGLDRVIEISLTPLAERAKLGQRMGKKDFLFDRDFLEEFSRRSRQLELSRNITRSSRLLFRACLHAVQSLVAQNDPENLRHADLLALFAFHRWAEAGCVQIDVFFSIAGRPRFNQRFEGPDLERRQAFFEIAPSA